MQSKNEALNQNQKNNHMQNYLAAPHLETETKDN
jgi:hypothetical protein